MDVRIKAGLPVAADLPDAPSAGMDIISCRRWATGGELTL